MHPINCFVDFSRRHSNVDPAQYALKWKAVNDYALSLAKLFPNNVMLVSLPALLSKKANTMHSICEWLGIPFHEQQLKPTWLSAPLHDKQMGPFGGLPIVSLEHEINLLNSHSSKSELMLQICTGSLSAFTEFGIDLTGQ